jgi:hypothetical protein
MCVASEPRQLVNNVFACRELRFEALDLVDQRRRDLGEMLLDNRQVGFASQFEYRVKSSNEAHERIATENQIRRAA